MSKFLEILEENDPDNSYEKITPFKNMLARTLNSHTDTTGLVAIPQEGKNVIILKDKISNRIYVLNVVDVKEGKKADAAEDNEVMAIVADTALDPTDPNQGAAKQTMSNIRKLRPLAIARLNKQIEGMNKVISSSVV